MTENHRNYSCLQTLLPGTLQDIQTYIPTRKLLIIQRFRWTIRRLQALVLYCDHLKQRLNPLTTLIQKCFVPPNGGATVERGNASITSGTPIHQASALSARSSKPPSLTPYQSARYPLAAGQGSQPNRRRQQNTQVRKIHDLCRRLHRDDKGISGAIF